MRLMLMILGTILVVAGLCAMSTMLVHELTQSETLSIMTLFATAMATLLLIEYMLKRARQRERKN